MARRSMKAKIQPAVETLQFNYVQTANNSKQTKYIDISQCVSIVNRRFYRQGLNWAVGSIRIFAQADGSVGVNKIPNTWISSNAWTKGFRTWQKMIKDATEDSGMESIKGKFLDFKIYANSSHHTAGFSNNLLPVDVSLTPANTGQWQPSEFVIPNTPGDTATGQEIVMVGANNSPTYVSLIQGYADSRSLPGQTEPNVPDDASLNWYQYLFSEGTTQDNMVITDLENTGDKAPYPYENDGTHTDTQYPGGETQMPHLQMHDVALLTQTTVGAQANLKGGNFPCGLMEISTIFPQNTAVVVVLDLIPGKHRGYLAESMLEM